MRAIILGAGGGTRMQPLTSDRPKILLPVAGKPLLAWTLEAISDAGIRDVTVVVNHQAAQLQQWLRNHGHQNVRVSRQLRRDGTAKAVAAGWKSAKEPVLIVYGDVVVRRDDLLRLSKKTGTWIAAFRVDDARAFGSIQSRGGRLRKIHEKSKRPPSREVFAGLARLEPDFLPTLRRVKKSARGEYELPDAFNAHAAAGRPVLVHRLQKWLEAGRPWDLLGIQEELMSGRKDVVKKGKGAVVEDGVYLSGHVEIGPGTRVRSGTYIQGPVVIGRDCQIGPRAYLRPSTSIGDGCHVGASVEIKNSILFERTNVPHLTYVGDSVLGAQVNLGAGTNVANLKVTPGNVRVMDSSGNRIDSGRRKLGTIIGSGTKIGINCSINPGTVIANDCLVGAASVLSGFVAAKSRLLGLRAHAGRGRA